MKNDITFPDILFVDGHRSHLTPALSNFCSEKKIVLIALYPNATHMLQPLDVALFRLLKFGWKEKVKSWKIENNGAKLKKKHVGTVLKGVVEKYINVETIANGLRSTGLFPLDPYAIKCNKYSKGREVDMKTEDNDKQLKKKLRYFGSKINSDTQHFQNIAFNHMEWQKSR